jgi:hypothetical protein
MGMIEQLKYILGIESTRFAELLLGAIKIMLGLSLMLYIIDPPRRGSGLSLEAALGIGLLLFLVGATQVVGVLKQAALLRQVAVLLATVVWISFVGTVWLSTGSVRPVLVYLPLVAVNLVVSRRVAKLGRMGSKRGPTVGDRG